MRETQLPSAKSSEDRSNQTHAVRRVVMRRATTSGASTVAPPEVNSLSVADFENLVHSYLLTGDINRHALTTLENRRYRLSRLTWLANHRGWKSIGYTELQAFFHYLRHGHEEPGGRWGNAWQTKPTKSGTAKSFHTTFTTFFNWCVAEEELTASPMKRLRVPIDRADQVEPYDDKQVYALLCAAGKTHNAQRNVAIINVLLDCGLRVSELCALRIGDVNFDRSQITVREGKGGKSRSVPFAKDTHKALWNYLQKQRRGSEPTETLFLSERGTQAGVGQLNRCSVGRLIQRLGEKVGLKGVRCSPHTFRHYFAVSFLRGGGNVFSLQALLGHTDLAMTNRYVSLAQADIATAHRTASPGDNLYKHER